MREVLILEAKRDLYEKLLMLQAEQDEKNQERARRMFEWEERKHIQESLDKEQALRKKEKSRLMKQLKQEKSYGTFKEWLKVSLLK